MFRNEGLFVFVPILRTGVFKTKTHWDLQMPLEEGNVKYTLSLKIAEDKKNIKLEWL
jgi:hypothetical protein